MAKPNQDKLTSIVMGAASLILGVMLFTNPTGAALLVTRIVGIVILVPGVIALVNYLMKGSQTPMDLFVGVAETVIGAVLTLFPGAFVNWLVVIAGVFILVMGLRDLSVARYAAGAGASFANSQTIMAIISMVFGLLVIVSPFAFVDIAFIIAGIGLVVNGVTELIAVFKG